MDCATLTHTVQLRTQDGQTLDVPCHAQQTLLDAAEAAGLRLSAQCRQGSCGACHAQVLSGAYVLGEHSPSALPKGEAAVLLCRTSVQSDAVVALPYGSERIGRGELPRRAAQVSELVRDGEHTVRLVLTLQPDEPDGVAVAEFEPGQFVELELASDVAERVGLAGQRRAYSLANTGNWDGRLELLIRLYPQGRFSRWLREHAQVGDVLTVHGPQGAFGLKENGLRPRWFVAGGTGLAPMLSMLRRMAEFGEPHPARLFFGVNTEAELFGAEALAELQATLPHLAVQRCVWRPAAAWGEFSGSVVDALRAALTDVLAQAGSDAAQAAWPDIYLCGPAGMVTAVEAVAAELGVPAGQVEAERFTAA